MNRDMEMLTLLLLDPFLTVDEASREAAAMPLDEFRRLRRSDPAGAAPQTAKSGRDGVSLVTRGVGDAGFGEALLP